jgi:hypothetical protein
MLHGWSSAADGNDRRKVMKAFIEAIRSGKEYKDGKRRVQLRIEGATLGFNQIVVPVDALESVPTIDQELEIRILDLIEEKF